MATRRQARRLKELGFKQSQKHIMANFTRGQAGAIIRKEEGRAPKKSWTITVPARPFLGASVAVRTRMTEIIRTETLKSVA